MTRGSGWTERETAVESTDSALSCTRTANWKVPADSGVPESTPVAGCNVNPVGSTPTVTTHLYGTVPPFAVKVAVYAAATVAAGGGAEVMLSRTAAGALTAANIHRAATMEA